MKRKYGDAFDFEIVTEGSFKDEGFNICTIVIRLSCTAMNEWIMSDLLDTRLSFSSDKEWEEYKTIQKKAQGMGKKNP